MLSLAMAQECRLTPVSPFVPAQRIEDGERATESQTFATAVSAVSPANQLHFVDTVNRLRRLEASGRLTTLAGNGTRATDLAPGDALRTPMPSIGQLLFSPSGVLYFTAVQRVWKLEGGQILLVAGTGRPGFNGEDLPALDTNLGGLVNATFGPDGLLYLVDGFNRVRRLESDGVLKTIAGSTRIAPANGLLGDGGPAREAALSNPRQVVPLRDGKIWIRDLGGRHLREIAPDGRIRTVETSFDTGISILMTADGRPAGITANRFLLIDPDGQLDTTTRVYPAFTGTPRAVGPNGALYFEGSARPEQRTPMVRLLNGQQSVVASAPAALEVDAQAPPFGVWRNGALLYSSASGGKAGILEIRPGQSPRFVVGGGDQISEAEGKNATDLTMFGIQTFSVDGAGRLIVADTYRRRLLEIAADGKVTELKSNDGQPIAFAPQGTFGSLQRIAADNAGNVYWYQSGGTPTGGVFTADLAVWTRSDRNIRTIRVVGLVALTKRENGDVAVIAGNATNFRSLYPVTPAGLGPAVEGLRLLPLSSVTGLRGEPHFTAASRLFRGVTGRLEYLEIPFLPTGAAFTPDFVLAAGDTVLIRSAADGGFYRLDNAAVCPWQPQPRIASEGIRNAASFANANTVSQRQLITIFGTGLGPATGQGFVLDGSLRAGGQPAPFPALNLGGFTGAIPVSTLTGTALPVLFSNDRQVTVQAPVTVPTSGEYFLFFSWQGLQLFHDETIRYVPANPGLFAVEGDAAALNENGSRNTESNPAAPGSVVQLYATGLGATTGTLGIGEFAPTNTTVAVTAPVEVTINGASADVLFAGLAPGQIGGLYQINVRIPSDATPGPRAVKLTVGAATSPTVNLWVR